MTEKNGNQWTVLKLTACAALVLSFGLPVLGRTLPYSYPINGNVEAPIAVIGGFEDDGGEPLVGDGLLGNVVPGEAERRGNQSGGSNLKIGSYADFGRLFIMSPGLDGYQLDDFMDLENKAAIRISEIYEDRYIVEIANGLVVEDGYLWASSVESQIIRRDDFYAYDDFNPLIEFGLQRPFQALDAGNATVYPWVLYQADLYN